MYEKLFLLLPTAATIGRQSKPARFMGCFSSILNGDSWRHFPQVGPELAKVGLKTSITIDITMEPVDIFKRRYYSTFNFLIKSSRLYLEIWLWYWINTCLMNWFICLSSRKRTVTSSSALMWGHFSSWQQSGLGVSSTQPRNHHSNNQKQILMLNCIF